MAFVCIHLTKRVDGWIDGLVGVKLASSIASAIMQKSLVGWWMERWMGRRERRFKDCIAHSSQKLNIFCIKWSRLVKVSEIWMIHNLDANLEKFGFQTLKLFILSIADGATVNHFKFSCNSCIGQKSRRPFSTKTSQRRLLVVIDTRHRRKIFSLSTLL